MKIEFKNIQKNYGAVAAVQDLNLTIKEGALHFFLGPSGCGKTTLLRLLAGLEEPTSGKILFNGQDVTKSQPAERGVSMVFQNYALWPHMTVGKNIEFGLRLRKLSATHVKERLDEVLSLTQLTPYVDRLPGQLSGGQQQRVALARALAIKPNALLLDEPLSNLDANLRNDMREQISRIHRQLSITTVYVTHDQKEALSMGTEVSVMKAGQLIQTDTPRNLYRLPNSAFIAAFIGETNLIGGTLKAKVNGLWEIDTPLGILRSSAPMQGFNPGEAVTVSIRPEVIIINPDAQETTAENQFKLPLQRLTYLGESEQLLFSENGAQLKVSHYSRSAHEMREGSLVRFFVNAKDVLIVPRETK